MIERVARLVRQRPGLLGALGAVLVLAGASWYQALITPPYRFVDEQAHAGYVLSVQSGHLPSIDTPIDQANGGVALRTRLAAEPARRRDVWVANNPPLTYVVAAGPAAITRALGLPGGPLMGLRLVNVAAVAAAVALAYRLGRDLAGGDVAVGLTTAGLVAATPHLGFVAALGFNDGVAVLTATGLTLALARVAGAGPRRDDPEAAAATERRSVVELGAWCAAAALTRPMSLVLAVAAGVIGLAVVRWRRSAPLGWAAAWLAGPTALGAGWFYALNVSRYGDPTGSDTLFDKFGRQPSGSLWHNLALRGRWESVLRTITTRRIEQPLPGDPRSWYDLALVVLLAGVALAVVAVVRSARRLRREAAAPSGEPALPWRAWVAVAVLLPVPVVLTAQHASGGGAVHPRYLLPMLPPLAAAVALGVVRFATRWAAAALVTGAAAVTFLQTRASARWLAAHPSGPPGSELVTAYGNQVLRGAGLGVTALGLVVLVASLAWPRH